MKRLVFAVTIFLVAFNLILSQNNDLPPNAPEDRPFSAKEDQWNKLLEAMQPYVEKARQSYPDAKKRFLEGLPPGHIFYTTTRLIDANGHQEQVFIKVEKIKKKYIKGLIASPITMVQGFSFGDKYKFPEAELIDWLISRPDGTEEGNIVGKFLDEYQNQFQK